MPGVGGGQMNVRRVLLDVDKAIDRPELGQLAQAISDVPGVEAANITVTEIDQETVSTDVTVVGSNLDISALYDAIEKTGAVVHSIDEIVFGDVVLEPVKRLR